MYAHNDHPIQFSEEDDKREMLTKELARERDLEKYVLDAFHLPSLHNTNDLRDITNHGSIFHLYPMFLSTMVSSRIIR